MASIISTPSADFGMEPLFLAWPLVFCNDCMMKEKE
jgi:hypothetical protein